MTGLRASGIAAPIDPAPKTRETLAGIREAARRGVTIEDYAPTIGLTPSRLATWCRDAQIPMMTAQVAAKAQEEAAAAEAKAQAESAFNTRDDGEIIAGLLFEFGRRRVWSGDVYIDLPLRADEVLRMVAKSAPRAVRYSTLVTVLWPNSPQKSRDQGLTRCVNTLNRLLPEIGCRLVQLDGGHLALAECSGTAKASRAAVEGAGV